MIGMTITVISCLIIAFFIYLNWRRKRVQRNKVDKELEMLDIAPTGSGKTIKHIEPIIHLAELSRKLLKGLSSADDLQKWEYYLEIAVARGLIKEPAIQEFTDDHFIKYLLLHHPEHPRLPENMKLNRLAVLRSVETNMVSTALWEAYQRLCEAEYRADSWFTTYEMYFEPDNSNEVFVVVKKQADVGTLRQLLWDSHDHLKEALKTSRDGKWEYKTKQFLSRLQDLQTLSMFGGKEEVI